MRPFVLLQLSDLHFGPNSRFAGVDMAELAGRCAAAIRDAREALAWNEEVGLVLVTGDVAEAARPREYESALVFFGALVERLGLPRSSVVFVPGNHDVSWTQCEAIAIKQRDGLFEENELRGRLDAVKLARFDDMVARFYDPSLPRHDDVGPGPAKKQPVEQPVLMLLVRVDPKAQAAQPVLLRSRPWRERCVSTQWARSPHSCRHRMECSAK